MRLLAVVFVHNPPQGGRLWLASRTLYPLIRLFTRSRWNHVALLCQAVDGGRVVVEALGPGVVCTPLAAWEGRAERLVESVPWEAELPWLPGVLGTRYDYATLLWWKGIKLATGRWHGPTGEAARAAVTCSELGAMAAAMPEPWDKSPQEVYVWLLARLAAAARVAAQTRPTAQGAGTVGLHD